MFDFFTLAELVLGPLMLARVPHLEPAPNGIVVRPDVPLLDMTVELTGAAAVPSLTGQRPQPSQDGGALVKLAPEVVFASPEALDRIDAALDEHGAIAVYPWQKTAKRYEALSMFFLLASTMTMGCFSAFGWKAARIPEGLRGWTSDLDATPKVYGGGYIVAERRYPGGVRELTEGWTERIVNARAAHPIALFATMVFFIGAAATAIRLFSDPTWGHFAWYAAYVFSISICLRQVGKFARLATALDPITLAFFLVIALRVSPSMRGQRARAARAARRANS